MQVNQLPTNARYIETLNGWIITQRIIGSPASYYRAEKGHKIHTSKNLNYVRNLAKSR